MRRNLDSALCACVYVCMSVYVCVYMYVCMCMVLRATSTALLLLEDLWAEN